MQSTKLDAEGVVIEFTSEKAPYCFFVHCRLGFIPLSKSINVLDLAYLLLGLAVCQDSLPVDMRLMTWVSGTVAHGTGFTFRIHDVPDSPWAFSAFTSDLSTVPL
jgi:hypothetical protein